MNFLLTYSRLVFYYYYSKKKRQNARTGMSFLSNEIHLMKRGLMIVSICKKQHLIFDEIC